MQQRTAQLQPYPRPNKETVTNTCYTFGKGLFPQAHHSPRRIRDTPENKGGERAWPLDHGQESLMRTPPEAPPPSDTDRWSGRGANESKVNPKLKKAGDKHNAPAPPPKRVRLPPAPDFSSFARLRRRRRATAGLYHPLLKLPPPLEFRPGVRPRQDLLEGEPLGGEPLRRRRLVAAVFAAFVVCGAAAAFSGDRGRLREAGGGRGRGGGGGVLLDILHPHYDAGGGSGGKSGGDLAFVLLMLEDGEKPRLQRSDWISGRRRREKDKARRNGGGRAVSQCRERQGKRKVQLQKRVAGGRKVRRPAEESVRVCFVL